MPLLHRRKRSTSVEASGPSTPANTITISAPAKMQPSTSGSSSRQRRTSADPLPLQTLTRATLSHMRTGSIPVISSSGVTSTTMAGSSKGKEKEKERGRERHKDKKERRSEDGHTMSLPSSSKGKERDMGGPAETSMPPLYARFAKGASVERPTLVEEPRRERTESHRTAAEAEERQRRREERKRREEWERIDRARILEVKPESPLSTLERRAHRDAEREWQRDQERERERDREARRRERERQAMEREVARAGEREERRRRRREEREAEAQRARDAASAHAREEDAKAREEQARAEDERRRDESRRKEEEDRMRQEEDERRREEARRRYEEEMRRQEEARTRQEEAQEAEQRRREDFQRQHEAAQRQQEQAQRQYEAEMQAQRVRTTSLQSQATPAQIHDGKRTSSRAPAPYPAPSSVPSNPSNVSNPTSSYPLADASHPPDYAPLVAHHVHHQHSSSLHAYPPGPSTQPVLSLRPSRSFENARSRRPSHTGPPLSPSARHNERGHGYGGGHHRSLSSGASVAGVSVRSHGLPTPPSSASSAIGQPSRPGSVQAPNAHPVVQAAAAAQTAGSQQQQVLLPPVVKSPSKTSVDKPLPTPVAQPAPAGPGPVPPSPTTETSSKPRRKYSLLAAFGLKSKGKEDEKVRASRCTRARVLVPASFFAGLSAAAANVDGGFAPVGVRCSLSGLPSVFPALHLEYLSASQSMASPRRT